MAYSAPKSSPDSDPDSYQGAGASKDEKQTYQLTMDLEMKAQKLGYEEEDYEHILESPQYDTEDDGVELRDDYEEGDEELEEDDSQLRINVEDKLNQVLKDSVEEDLSLSSSEFVGDVSAVRFDPGGSSFMRPDVFGQNLSFFYALLSNRFASLIKREDLKEWKETSRYHYLTDEEIFESLIGGSEIQRAFRADALTRFLVITMEEDSYYRANGMVKLTNCLERAGIYRTKLYKASDSEQWQMFVFFEKPVRADLITKSVSAWLRRNSIVPGTAGLDIFPGPGALTIPLQPGFEFLNQEGLVICARNEITLEAALALFLNDMVKVSVRGMEVIEKIDQLTRD